VKKRYLPKTPVLLQKSLAQLGAIQSFLALFLPYPYLPITATKKRLIFIYGLMPVSLFSYPKPCIVFAHAFNFHFANSSASSVNSKFTRSMFLKRKS
jgi:hypothetical protein